MYYPIQFPLCIRPYIHVYMCITNTTSSVYTPPSHNYTHTFLVFKYYKDNCYVSTYMYIHKFDRKSLKLNIIIISSQRVVQNLNLLHPKFVGGLVVHIF